MQLITAAWPSPRWRLTACFHTARFHTSHFALHPPTPAPAQLRIYEDEDGARKEEIAALAQPESGSFAAFYDRLKEVKEYYRRFPTTDVTEVRGAGGREVDGLVGKVLKSVRWLGNVAASFFPQEMSLWYGVCLGQRPVG